MTLLQAAPGLSCTERRFAFEGTIGKAVSRPMLLQEATGFILRVSQHLPPPMKAFIFQMATCDTHQLSSA